MGRKVHPIGFRLGIVKDWQGRWYAERDFAKLLLEDIELRKYIQTRLRDAAVPQIEIERSANNIAITVHTAKPGIVIGRSGAKVEELRKELEKRTGKRVNLKIAEINVPEINATLVARSIAEQVEKRVAYKRAVKQAVQRAMQRGAKGVRVVISGRLGGAEMSRRYRESQGKVPLHTIRADIDYGTAEALTTFGMIGIKVWIYKGDILPEAARSEPAARSAPPPAPLPTPTPAPAAPAD